MHSEDLDTKGASLSDPTWIRKEGMGNYIFYKLTRNGTREDTHSHRISSEKFAFKYLYQMWHRIFCTSNDIVRTNQLEDFQCYIFPDKGVNGSW